MSDLSIGNLLGPQMGPTQTDSTGLHLQTEHDLAIDDLAIGDLAIECFGVHAMFMWPPISRR